LVAPRPYADASALVKLLLREPESDALRSYLLARPDPATSRISAVEVARAMARAEGSPQDEALAALWERTLFVEVDASLADSAARLEPPALRSLDAIHLASALALADELEAFVTYDARQADVARAVGLEVVSPT
jgi:predicted nucleic acid-binding protein